MEDFERIQHREGERQKLLEELKKVIWESEENFLARTPEGEAEKAKGAFRLFLSMSFALYLLYDGKFDFSRFLSPVKKRFGRFSVGFVSKKIMPKIKSFTSVEAEQFFLIGSLLEYSIGEIRRPFDQKILELSVPPGRDWFLKEVGLDKLE